MKLHLAAFVLSASAAACVLGACTGADPILVTGDDGTTTDSGTPGPGSDSSTPGEQGDSSTTTGDGGTGTDAADAGPRFCDSQTLPATFTNFFCADFDGANVGDGWTKSNVPDAGGALTKNTDIYHSSPNSFSASGGATLEWDSTGAANINEIQATFQFNVGTLGGVVAPQSGHVTILKIDSGDTNLSINYASGATVDGTANYTGYYATVTACPGACTIDEHKISGSFTPNTWTEVHVQWASIGAAAITFNGTSVYSVATLFPATTKFMTTIGPVPVGVAPPLPRAAFDDVRIAIRR